MQLLLPPPYLYTLRMRSIYKRADIVCCLDEIDRQKTNHRQDRCFINSNLKKCRIDYIINLKLKKEKKEKENN